MVITGHTILDIDYFLYIMIKNIILASSNRSVIVWNCGIQITEITNPLVSNRGDKNDFAQQGF